MHHPFQVLAVIPANQPGQIPFLLAGSGPVLISINLQDGTISSRWETPLLSAENINTKVESTTPEGPPTKKRRVASEDRSNIVKVYAHETGKYVIVVTGEDKCIRVFSISTEGKLNQISERQMMKRPSALAMLGADTILCADKFGDVYSLPLISTKEDDKAAAEQATSTSTQKQFVPSATELTVHSKSNRRILELQRKLAEENTPVKTKEQMLFAHKLLLGHISMTTALLAPEVVSKDGCRKRYIITSDRDEHIRVSRGPPQAYVIENFCLGHRKFVSSMCMATNELLASGGGDNHIFIWDWQKGALRAKLDLMSAVLTIIGDSKISNDDESRIAVSGIWRYESVDDEKSLLMTCEGVPALFHCRIDEILDSKCQIQAIPLSGNVLDVGVYGDFIIVSIDNIHQPGTQEVDSSLEFKPRLLAVRLHKREDGDEKHLNRLLVDANELMTSEWHEETLKKLLYHVENLRNRRGGAEGNDEE